MSSVNKRTIRQYKLDETRGNIAHPGGRLENLIEHTLGPGSRMSQDKWGDSFIKPPSPSSQSDVFGKDASSQGFRLSKPGK
jgi:hypothetical protein